MPPALALFLTVGFIAFLFRRDFREKPQVTSALWIPFFWVFIIGSRYISQWLAVFGIHVGGIALEDGSPVDALVFGILLISGCCVLVRRRVIVSEIVSNNRWLTIFLIYSFLAIIWSDFPFVAFKRWIKAFGHPILALVILSEPDPDEAFIRLMKRCAYVLIPVSVLFIKYFPELGRGFDQTGMATNTGVTTNKNELGYVCLIFGYFFGWRLLEAWHWLKGKARRNEVVFCVGFLWMIGWLLNMAHSATSLLSLVIATSMLIVVRSPSIDKRYIGTYALLGIVGCAILEFGLQISAHVLAALGKDPTLTDRTKVWADVIRIQNSPMFGAGFESFWLGERLKTLWEIYWWRPNQAHNGYLETYLNLGLVGLGMLVVLIFGTFRKIRVALIEESRFAHFRFGFLFAVLAYNWTEAAFKALHLMWFMFFVIAMSYPKPEPMLMEEPAQDDDAKGKPEFAL